MGLRNLLYSGGLALALATSAYAQNDEAKQSVNQSEAKESTEKHKDIISMERIEALMKRGSVDDILKEEYENGSIKHLVYDPENPEESAKKYKEFVFQENLDPKDRKDVLVMFYDDNIINDERGYNAIKREAIIFKEIERIYGDRIKSLSFRIDWPYGEDGRPTKDPKKIPYGGNLKKLIGTWIRGPPSIAMHGQFDLLKGETPEKNDGKIKHLDTLFGGPSANKWVDDWLYGDKASTGWIESNILKPNGEYAVRVNNSKPIKVEKMPYNNKSD